MRETEPVRLDRTDHEILKALCEDGRLSDVALAERINLSSTAVSRRRKILEDRGVIAGYSARPDLAVMGYGVLAMVSIELSSQAEVKLEEFERAVMRCPSVSFCGFVSGGTDFQVMIHVRSFEDYDTVYRQELCNLPHVSKIKTSFVIREVSRVTVPRVIFTPGT